MPSGAIVLTQRTRRSVDILDFEQQETGWRVVLERPGAKERDRPKVTVKEYATRDEAWKDIEAYVREGFRIALYSE